MRKDKGKFNRGKNTRMKIQSELARKPHFLSIFAKTLCVMCLVAILVGVVGTYVARMMYISDCRNRIDNLLEDGQASLEESYREASSWMTPDEYELGDVDEQEPVIENKDIIHAMQHQLNYRLDRLCTSGEREEGCLAVYYGEEKLVDSLETIYSLAKEEEVFQSPVSAHDVDGDSVYDGMFYTEVYELDVQQIEKEYPGLVDEIMNQVATFNEDAGADVYYATYDESGVYYKQGAFIPEYIAIYTGYEGNEEAEDILVERYDLENVDTTGYQYVTSNSGIFVPKLLKVGCKTLGEQGAYYSRHIQSVYDCKEEWHESFWGVECMDYRDVRLGNEAVTVVAIATYHMLHEYGTVLIVSYAVLLVVAVLIALLISYFTFQKKQVRYEIESYRRNTTNAMAHDLKSPLMAISAYAENLVNGVNPEKNTYYGEAILDTVSYMDQVIANILNLSKIEHGPLRLNKEQIDIRGLIETHLPKYELIMRERDLQVSVNGECSLQCDRLWMTQLVDNLLSNAMKYAKGHSTITVCLQEDSLVVSNEFEGELCKTPDELMESFVKGDNARSNSQGTGIGLAIVNHIARAHNFQVEIQVENKEPQQIFEVRIYIIGV